MDIMSKAFIDVARERTRQQMECGNTKDIDDSYQPGLLTNAAMAYLSSAFGNINRARCYWPSSWTPGSFKPKELRTDLVKGASLAIAEIEKIDRANGEGEEMTKSVYHGGPKVGEVKALSGDLANSKKEDYLGIPADGVYPKHRVVFTSGKHLNIFGVKKVDLSGSWSRIWDYRGVCHMYDPAKVDYIEIKESA